MSLLQETRSSASLPLPPCISAVGTSGWAQVGMSQVEWEARQNVTSLWLQMLRRTECTHLGLKG